MRLHAEGTDAIDEPPGCGNRSLKDAAEYGDSGWASKTLGKIESVNSSNELSLY